MFTVERNVCALVKNFFFWNPTGVKHIIVLFIMEILGTIFIWTKVKSIP